jgi:hypothetical protein
MGVVEALEIKKKKSSVGKYLYFLRITIYQDFFKKLISGLGFMM